MKQGLTHTLLAGLLLGLPASMQAQVSNGDFETSLATPRGINNIYSYQGGYQYDDLSSWEGVLVVPPNAGAYPGYSLGGDYLSLVPGAAARVNPQGTPDGGVFQPHGGNSCIALRRFPASGNIADQGVWSQPVPIVPGHTYQLDYYVLRRPTSQYAEKIKVIVSTAGAQWAASSSTSKDISAQNNPYASVTSPAITDYQNWTHVTGTFTAQTRYTTGPTANTSYLTITYDRPLGTYDPNLYVASGNYNFSYYAIDDISLVDVTCVTPTPIIVENPINTDRCKGYIGYKITNFDPANQYTVNIVSGSINALPAHPTTALFRIKGGIGTPGGTFSVTATASGCGPVTTSEYFASLDCSTDYRASAATAYPNPAAESITIPEGAESATLVNDKGKVLGKSGKNGKVDVQSLPDGLYNLQIMQDGKLINQRIQVKH